MASLREIKSKIHSVKSTQQITSAMRMVSTVKLQKAQRIIERFFPYQQQVTELLINFLSREESSTSIYEEEREVKRVAIIAFSSNMGLCGSFNANIAKELKETVSKYEHLGKDNITIYPIGKKIAQATKKMGYTPAGTYGELANEPNYNDAIAIADKLMSLFRTGAIDKVIVIYHHFKSKGSQVVAQQKMLPISLEEVKEKKDDTYIKYIIEPDKESILEELIPKVIRIQFYTYLLESHTSEHAARTLAMQAATDNADDLLEELSLVYNKSRQQSITNELLDIIGATFK